LRFKNLEFRFKIERHSISKAVENNLKSLSTKVKLKSEIYALKSANR
jgi:hypothetical protein